MTGRHAEIHGPLFHSDASNLFAAIQAKASSSPRWLYPVLLNLMSSLSILVLMGHLAEATHIMRSSEWIRLFTPR